jgi:outer membrane protein assembly factor BamB
LRDEKRYNVGAIDRNGNTITLEYEIELPDDGKRTSGPAWTYSLVKQRYDGKVVFESDLVTVKSNQYWPWHNPFLYNQLILDGKGSIIVVGMGGSSENPAGHIYKASSEGALQWEAKLPMVRAADSKSQRGHPFTLPVVDTDDKIYLGAGSHIYCVSAQGEVLWKKNLASRITASPLLGNAKTLYVATADRMLYALSLDAKVLWKIRILYHRPSELVMDNRGVLYFPLYRGLRAALQTESTGPMDSAWPMFMHDQYNSGNAAFRISDLP